MREETEHAATRLMELGSFFVSPGHTTEEIHHFHVTGLHEVGQQLAGDEHLVLLHVRRAAVRTMLHDGASADAKTIMGLRLLFQGSGVVIRLPFEARRLPPQSVKIRGKRRRQADLPIFP